MKTIIGILSLILTEFIIFATPIFEIIGFEEFKKSIGIIVACFAGCFALIKYATKGFNNVTSRVVNEVSGVKQELHSLNVKVGDIANGLDMVKTSHDERIKRNAFLIQELASQVSEIKQQLIAP